MRISVVVGGLDVSTWRLQPWRYLWEVANELAARGHDVEVLSEDASSLSPRSVEVGCVDVASVNPTGESRPPTVQLRAHRPDIVLWNVGASSVLRLKPPRLAGTRNVAIFTSPVYQVSELLRVRSVILREPRSHGAHILGALLSPRRIARYLGTTYDRVIFPGRSARATLIRAGLPAGIANAIPPGRDSDLQRAPRDAGALDGVTFLYAGSPAPIRGADLLLRAFALIGSRAPEAKLVILSRQERPELARQTDYLRVLVHRFGLAGRVDIVAGTLPRQAFLDQLARADAIVLPFRLVPSEAPLAVLEAAGAGKPLIASAFPAIADLAAPGSLLVPPGNVRALARAMAWLAADPAKRDGMAGAAIRWYRDWPTWSEVGGRVEEVIRNYQGSGEGPSSRPAAQIAAVDGPRSILDEARA